VASEDFGPFTDEQWWALCSLRVGMPLPLSEACLDSPFVYDRKWGLFYVASGYHVHMMGLLLAFHHGYTDWIDFARSIGVKGGDVISKLADAYLEQIEGTAFKSSMGSHIVAGKRMHLSSGERMAFKGCSIRYLEDN
jgi:hypothetical protein